MLELGWSDRIPAPYAVVLAEALDRYIGDLDFAVMLRGTAHERIDALWQQEMALQLRTDLEVHVP